MTYLLIVTTALLLVACTAVYVGDDQKSPVNVQTSNSTEILGSQNVDKEDKESAGDIKAPKGSGAQGATSTPTVTVPINNPLGGQ